MRTIYGITFEQLHAFSLEDLQNTWISHSVKQAREAALNNPNARIDLVKLEDLTRKLSTRVIKSILDQGQIDSMRKLYDTEDRFNLASDMLSKMGNLSVRMQIEMEGMMPDILRETSEASRPTIN